MISKGYFTGNQNDRGNNIKIQFSSAFNIDVSKFLSVIVCMPSVDKY